jgi:hypothetical protein
MLRLLRAKLRLLRQKSISVNGRFDSPANVANKRETGQSSSFVLRLARSLTIGGAIWQVIFRSP